MDPRQKLIQRRVTAQKKSHSELSLNSSDKSDQSSCTTVQTPKINSTIEPKIQKPVQQQPQLKKLTPEEEKSIKDSIFYRETFIIIVKILLFVVLHQLFKKYIYDPSAPKSDPTFSLQNQLVSQLCPNGDCDSETMQSIQQAARKMGD